MTIHYHWDLVQGVSARSLLGCFVDLLGESLLDYLSEHLNKLIEGAEVNSETLQTASGVATQIQFSCSAQQKSIPLFSVPFSKLSKCADELATILLQLQQAEDDLFENESCQFGVERLLEIYSVLLSFDFVKTRRVSISVLPLAEGMMETSEGAAIPIPSPLALKFLIGLKTFPGPMVESEIVSPEACAILKQYSSNARPKIFLPTKISIGIDATNPDHIISRLLVGEIESDNHAPADESYTTSEDTDIIGTKWSINSLAHLKANLDDTTAEALAFAIQLFLDNGAADAWVTPIVMKKGRAAHTLHCLCASNDEMVHQLLALMFRHTTTLGVRIQRNIERAALKRSFLSVKTPYAETKVNVKIGYLGDEVVSVKPEFDHCKAIALASGVALKQITDYATHDAYEQLNRRDDISRCNAD